MATPLNQLQGIALLSNFAPVDHNNPVIVRDCVEPVRYGDNSCVLEPLPDYLLHEGIGLHIEIGGGLIKEEDLVLSQKHSGEAD